MKGAALSGLTEISDMPVIIVERMPVNGRGVEKAQQLLNQTLGDLNPDERYTVALCERSTSARRFIEDTTSRSLAAFLHASYRFPAQVILYAAPITREVEVAA